MLLNVLNELLRRETLFFVVAGHNKCEGKVVAGGMGSV